MVQCDSSDVAANISDAHVAVPFMASMSEAVLQQAPHLRLIIQFGVGVEGVDLAAVLHTSSSNALPCTCIIDPLCWKSHFYPALLRMTELALFSRSDFTASALTTVPVVLSTGTLPWRLWLCLCFSSMPSISVQAVHRTAPSDAASRNQ